MHEWDDAVTMQPGKISSMPSGFVCSVLIGRNMFVYKSQTNHEHAIVGDVMLLPRCGFCFIVSYLQPFTRFNFYSLIRVSYNNNNNTKHLYSAQRRTERFTQRGGY